MQSLLYANFNHVNLQIKAVLDVARKVKRIVLLSGTPSLSRLYHMPLKALQYLIIPGMRVVFYLFQVAPL